MKHPDFDPDEADEAIINFVAESFSRVTPLALTKYLKQHLNFSARTAGERIRHLVEKQALGYMYEFGMTFIDLNLLKPVQMSPHFVLSPPDYPPDAARYAGCIQIIIHPGISFGSGRHPTTRLCLRAIDMLAFQTDLFSGLTGYAADIGTGSGILAMALCRIKPGLKCIAYEIDPVSLSEALKNISSNQLSHQIQLRQDSFDAADPSFSIICANLRVPTLIQIAMDIQYKMHAGGILVLSGIRTWEKIHLISVYKETGFDLIWQADEKNWSCVVMIFRPDIISDHDQ